MKKSILRSLLAIISASLLFALMIIPANASTIGYASYDEDTGYASFSNIGYINYNNSTIGYDNENIRNTSIHSFYFGTTSYSFMGDAQVVISSCNWVEIDHVAYVFPPQELARDYGHISASLSDYEDYSTITRLFEVKHTVYTNTGVPNTSKYTYQLDWQTVAPTARLYTFYEVGYSLN